MKNKISDPDDGVEALERSCQFKGKEVVTELTGRTLSGMSQTLVHEWSIPFASSCE